MIAPRLILRVATAWLLHPLAVAAAPVPDRAGYVVDRANVLTLEQRAALDEKLERYETDTGHEIAVLLVPSIGAQTIGRQRERERGESRGGSFRGGGGSESE